MAEFEKATAASSAPMALHINSTPDILKWLPEGAAGRLRALRQHAADLHALTVPFAEIQEASAARVQAEQRLQRLQNHPHQGGFNLSGTDARVIEHRRVVEKLTADFKRLNERSETRSQAWQAASTVLSAVQTWLRDGRPPGTALEDFDGPEPKLNKSESITDGIERIRRRARELKADRNRVRSAPHLSSHCKAKARAAVEALAARGAVNVSRLVEHDGEIEWPSQHLMVPVRNAQPGAVGFVEVPDTLALIAWTFKDTLINRLDAEIDSEADDAAALTPEARQKAEAEMMGDLLAVERQEAALVWGAMDEKLPVEHRADISPLALLGLRLITAPRAGASPGSSTEHAYDIVMTGRR